MFWFCREWSAPPPMDYAVYGANTSLMVMVAMVYAPLAPIVAVMATAAFFASSWVTKYMLLVRIFAFLPILTRNHPIDKPFAVRLCH